MARRAIHDASGPSGPGALTPRGARSQQEVISMQDLLARDPQAHEAGPVLRPGRVDRRHRFRDRPLGLLGSPGCNRCGLGEEVAPCSSRS